MKKRLVCLLLTLALALSLAAVGTVALAADDPAAAKGSTTDFPKGAITMVIPYGAGGTSDLAGRQFEVALEKYLGVDVVPVNQPGASASIGSQAVLDAPHDGYTILLSAEAPATMRVMGISDISFDDFTPITMLTNDPKVIVVKGDSKYATIDDLLADIQANPGRIQMSYTGPGGSGHIQALIMTACGYEPALTAYSGGADGIKAVLSGEVVFTNSNYSTVKSYLESGDLKCLAVASTTPLPGVDAPVLSDAMPGSEAYMDLPYSPLSLVVPNDTPEEVVAVLRRAAAKAVADPDFTAYVEANSLDKLYEKYPTPEDAKEFYANLASTVCWLLDDAGATVESPETFNIPRIG